MVSPQSENGYTRISNELLEAITRFPFSKREYQILLAIIRKTYGYGKLEDDLGITQLAKMTGLQHTHAAKTVRDLIEKDVLFRNSGHYAHILGVNKNFLQWGNVKTVISTMTETVISTMTETVIPTMTETVIPTITETVIPTMTETVIPTMTETVIPTMTETVIPTMTETVIPTMTETVIGGDQNSHSGMTETVRGGVTVSVTTKENQPKENPKRKPPLQKTVLTKQKNEVGNESSSGDFLNLENVKSSDLIFPKNFTQKEQVEAKKLLAKCDGQAQEILDTLDASIRTGEVKKSPLALLGGIVRRYEAGTFDPIPGLHIASARNKQARTQASVKASIDLHRTANPMESKIERKKPTDQIKAMKQALKPTMK